ncbi:hypothetical protein AAV95_18635 [Mycolicibacterium elephantis]|nr:hypothetical protein AAV95_18635 [Mycolicibacterium elephantis]
MSAAPASSTARNTKAISLSGSTAVGETVSVIADSPPSARAPLEPRGRSAAEQRAVPWPHRPAGRRPAVRVAPRRSAACPCTCRCDRRRSRQSHR